MTIYTAGKAQSRHSISISNETISDSMPHFALLYWLKKGFINIKSQASVPFIKWTASQERLLYLNTPFSKGLVSRLVLKKSRYGCSGKLTLDEALSLSVAIIIHA